MSRRVTTPHVQIKYFSQKVMQVKLIRRKLTIQLKWKGNRMRARDIRETRDVTQMAPSLFLIASILWIMIMTEFRIRAISVHPCTEGEDHLNHRVRKDQLRNFHRKNLTNCAPKRHITPYKKDQAPQNSGVVPQNQSHWKIMTNVLVILCHLNRLWRTEKEFMAIWICSLYRGGRLGRIHVAADRAQGSLLDIDGFPSSSSHSVIRWWTETVPRC